MTAPTPSLAGLDILEAARAQVGDAACGAVDARFDTATGRVVLSGAVDASVDLAALIGGVSTAAPETATGALRPLRAPVCGAVAMLSDAGIEPTAAQARLEAARAAGTAADDSVFAEGSALRVDFYTPPFTSYVYIDYFSADGFVVHLLSGSRRLPSEALAIGDGSELIRTVYAAPPYGQQMVLLVASQAPLFAAERDPFESADAYLQALETALAALAQSDPTARVEYGYHVVMTAPAGE
jgi:hypothetical protein